MSRWILTAKERFWSKVAKTNTCWLWNGTIERNTHCEKRHEYNLENTKRRRGGRECRICDKKRKKDAYHVKRAGQVFLR